MKLFTKLSEFKKIQENNDDTHIPTISVKRDGKLDSLDHAPETVDGYVDVTYASIDKYISAFNAYTTIEDKATLAKRIISSINSRKELNSADESLLNQMVDFIDNLEKLGHTIIPPMRRAGQKS